jgi:hypothetical protein
VSSKYNESWMLRVVELYVIVLTKELEFGGKSYYVVVAVVEEAQRGLDASLLSMCGMFFVKVGWFEPAVSSR